jgi:hypothetical protein
MGWCQEFGVPTREGCDHLMVAGRDSCTCPQCGMTCRGKFDGCVSVWRAGPTAVSLERRTKGGSNGTAETVPSVANGSGSTQTGADVAVRSALPIPIPAADAAGDLRPVLDAILSEVRALDRKVDVLADAVRAVAQAPVPPLTLAPEFRDLRLAVREDLVELKRRISADLAETERARPLPSVPPGLATLAELDARFEWLSTELSKRLVVIGNELVQMNQRFNEELAQATDL